MEHAMDGSLVAVIMNCVGKLAINEINSFTRLAPAVQRKQLLTLKTPLGRYPITFGPSIVSLLYPHQTGEPVLQNELHSHPFHSISLLPSSSSSETNHKYLHNTTNIHDTTSC
ncbi:hypothetical protein EYC84_001015 [Monilinia fructicola]|uniref:Uncharacterized protein n=1 Tax=Monilinia fructicola TaxID=38448 RepID=A0A5M9JNM7_MONFR|nr:hypothetical protein EYC84_001015 [Monilinia fructicola]